MQGMELIGRQTIFAEGCEGTLQKNYLKDLIYEKEGPTDFRFRNKRIMGYRQREIQTRNCFHSVGWPYHPILMVALFYIICQTIRLL